MPDPTDRRTIAEPAELHPSVANSADETARRTAPDEPKFGPPTAPGEVGTLGPYRVVKELGRGGMGTVYEALDTRLERALALKVMSPEFAAESEARERFLREARATAKVVHDNVVTVYEADERDGVPYIAMQLLQGMPLDQYLKHKGAPPLAHVVRIAREAALGLAAAHELGLVHRDIKPGNLWLEAPNGRVKVLDFGLAKPSDTNATLTGTGVVLGTPAYMSPEQARGQTVDHRSDLFSLGAVVYRLCTGKNPFVGEYVMAVLTALVNDDPKPVRELNPSVPDALAVLVNQMLAKRPEQRPQTAAEVAWHLRAILDQLLAPLVSPGAMSADASTSVPVVVRTLPVHPPVVPMQVTGTAEPAFAHLEDDERTEPASDSDKPEPQPKKGGKGILIAAGVSVLLAITAVAAVVLQKDKDKDKPKPDGQPVRSLPLPPAPTVKSEPGPIDWDRTAAEWVLSVGGTVRGSGPDNVGKGELSKGPFTLTYIDLVDRPVTTEGLSHLKGLKSLQFLDLRGTSATGAGLAHIRGLTTLRHLDLSGLKITDNDLAALQELRALRYLNLTNTPIMGSGLVNIRNDQDLSFLNLHGTRVVDAELVHLANLTGLTELGLYRTAVTGPGLVHLKNLDKLASLHIHETPLTDVGLPPLRELKGLTYLNVRQTQVTAKAVKEFSASVPRCRIIYDNGSIIEPRR
jgi:serine/threonine protein kinase